MKKKCGLKRIIIDSLDTTLSNFNAKSRCFKSKISSELQTNHKRMVPIFHPAEPFKKSYKNVSHMYVEHTTAGL